MRIWFIFLIILFLIFNSNAHNQTIDSLEHILEQTTQDSVRLRLLDEIVSHIYQTNFPKTIEYSSEALVLAQKLDNIEQEMRAHYFLGVGHLVSSNEKASIYHVERALEIAEMLPNGQKDQMDCHNLLGNIYQKLNNIDKSLQHFFASAKLAEEFEDLGRLATSYSNIGQVYMENEEHGKAKLYYSIALGYFLEDEDFFYAAFVFNNLSEVTESPDSSILLLNKALDIFEKEQYYSGIAHACNNLASEYIKLKDYQKALPNLEKAREIFESEAHYYKPGLVNVYMNLGMLHGESGDMAESEMWFEKSIELAIEIDHKVYLKKAYEQYSGLLERENKHRKAFQYFKLAAKVKDSLFNESKAQELAESETKYQTELKEKEIARKELEIEIQSKQKNRILQGSIILVLLLSGLFIFLRYNQRLRRQKAELDLQLEQAEAEKLRELDKVKSNFFANISHEFRTPLTLILGPLKQMRDGDFKGNFKKYNNIMIRNGERLMKLVNQLLDLSKLESGKMELNLEKADIVKSIRAMAYSFESLAENQDINFEVTVPDKNIQAEFDKDKLEKIIVNLLSNAFKFTPEKGRVAIELKITQDNSKPLTYFAEIKIEDTGIGIAPDQLPHIFKRFFQTSNTSDLQAGSGIGLALTKELVELSNGGVRVESKLDKGTVFFVKIPLGNVNIDTRNVGTDENTIVKSSENNVPANINGEAIQTTSSGPLLLLVEDNDDVRLYLKDQLNHEYNIVEATNGEEGQIIATEIIPDLIISDVMMPNNNGIEMCKLLKGNLKTSHIPIIMLTAKAEMDDKIEGLKTGADDYLMKPFDIKELKARIQNLIDQRKRLQKSFGQDYTFKPENININSIDEEFLSKVKISIEENFDDETFSVVELGRTVGMSRSQLHRKLKAMTNQSPNQIIRGMRLIRAKELLEKKAGNASEVAYMVGFSSLAYFSKCYSEKFNMPPSEV